MMRAERSTTRKKVLDNISAKRREFESLDDEERDRRTHALANTFHALPMYGQRIDCPACGTAGHVQGEVVRSGEPRLEDEEVIVETVALPVRFLCRVCGLRLNGHTALHVAGLGGQYIHRDAWDAFEYYDRGEPPEPDWDDYGND
jgi:hypothetical protein